MEIGRISCLLPYYFSQESAVLSARSFVIRLTAAFAVTPATTTVDTVASLDATIAADSINVVITATVAATAATTTAGGGLHFTEQ